MPTPNQEHFVIAFIPARAGSKGVPQKNTRLLGGIPLLGYTVAMAAKVQGIDRVVVSTEDHDLAAIAKEFGGEVPFLRPAELAKDDSNLSQVIDYTHFRLKTMWEFPQHYTLVTMMPTSPFRNLQIMEKLIAKAKEGYHVRTVCSICHNQETIYKQRDDGSLHSLLPGQKLMKKFYRMNGYCLATNWGVDGQLCEYFHDLKNPIARVDIDHWQDFFLAESIIQENLFDFGMKIQ